MRAGDLSSRPRGTPRIRWAERLRKVDPQGTVESLLPRSSSECGSPVGAKRAASLHAAWRRKLKTYQTSLGFFDLAIAAPSMKAALEAWGADSNLFHQGAAKESHDPDVVAATMAKPGVVLRRPVGSDGPFGEHAELPTDLGDADQGESRPQVERPQSRSSLPLAPSTRRRSERPLSPTNGSRSAAIANGKGKRPPRQKERERRQQAVDKAQAALDEAEREHAKTRRRHPGRGRGSREAIAGRGRPLGKGKERLEAALRRLPR